MTPSATENYSVTRRLANWGPADAGWLKDAVAKAGRQEDVAEAAGLSRPALVGILNGHRKPRAQTLLAICDALGLSLEAGTPLEAHYAQMIRRLEMAPGTDDAESIAVPEVDLAYGMGGAFIDDFAVTETLRKLPTDWVRQFTRAPAHQLTLCRGIGDSMMPTLLDSDLLLVDRSQDSLKQSDRIWVVMVGDVGMVKRIRVQPSGNLLILSDNENVPSMEAADGEAMLIGRVVAVIRKM